MPSTSNVQNAVDTATLSAYAAGSGNDKLVVFVSQEGDINGALGDGITCTFDGNSMSIPTDGSTSATVKNPNSTTGFQNHSAVFELDDPSGTGDIVIGGSNNNTARMGITAVLVNGVGAVDVVKFTRGPTGFSDPGDDVTVNFTTSTANAVAVGVYGNGGNGTTSPPTNWTELSDVSFANGDMETAWEDDLGASGAKSATFSPDGSTRRGHAIVVAYELDEGITMTAAAGSYALTGQAAATTKGHQLVAAAGSYALTGQAATTSKGFGMAAAAGSYALTGQATTLLKAWLLTAAAGSYAFTGFAATTSKGNPIMTAAAGSYALTGNNATTTSSSVDPNALRRDSWSPESDLPLALLEITHVDLPADIFVVNNKCDITSNSQLYTRFPFEIVLPDSQEDAPPRARLRIDNVSQEIVQAVRSITTAPTITIKAVRQDDLDVVEIEAPGMRFTNVRANSLVITGDLEFEDLIREPYPSQTFSPTEFPSLV